MREPTAAEPGPGHGGDDPTGPGWVLGVDSGGSGLRVALASAGDLTRPETTVSREPVRTGAAGIDAGHLLEQMLPMARELLARVGDRGPGVPRLSTVAVGAAGMATLGDGLRAELLAPSRPNWAYGGSRWPRTVSPPTRARSASGPARSSPRARA